ncbi:MAG: hypothetical protein FJ279_17560 [Planctomycetes bacterium]|nr:hypothetical protein [Planctomycetota bacterium]MBM4084631.1 hypothetical protein [Planctomycetota bacterium]
MNKVVEEIMVRLTDKIVRYNLTANDIMDMAAQLNRLAIHKAISEHLETSSMGAEEEEESKASVG